MQGSFVRRGIQARRDPGTRPGLHGQTLISTGLADLDALLEGGLPLGTVLLVLEDPHSRQHTSFIKYFLSEGIACGQKVKWVLPKEPAGGLAKFLPAQQAARTATQAGAKDEDDDSSGDEDKEQTELRIAWQYRKYIKVKQEQQLQQEQLNRQQQRAKAATQGPSTSGRPSTTQTPSSSKQGSTRAWAHKFDLRRSLDSEAVQRSGLQVSSCSGPDCWRDVNQEAVNFISQFMLPESAGPIPGIPSSVLMKGPEGVGRLVLQSLGSPAWCWTCRRQEEVETELLRCVLGVRQAVRDTRCTVMITCPAGTLRPSTQMRLQHMCDTVLLLQSISDSSDVVRLLPDPLTASALLALNKLPDAGMIVPRLPDTNLYVIRHKRRSITIQMVDVDPDAEAAMDQSSTVGQPGKPASALLCTGPPAAKKTLDF